MGPCQPPATIRLTIPERHHEDLADGVELEAFPRSVSVPLSGRVGSAETFDPRRGVCGRGQLRGLVLDPCCSFPIAGRTQDVDDCQADVAAAHDCGGPTTLIPHGGIVQQESDRAIEREWA
jgi:hypothetical protein